MAKRTRNYGYAAGLALLGAAALAALLILGPGGEESGADLAIGPAPRQGMHEVRFEAMGTDGRIVAAVDDPRVARAALEAAVGAVRQTERLMSTYRPDSEVSRLNRRGAGRAMDLSEQTLEVLRKAREVSQLTGGAFDVTYAPLRELWRNAGREGAVSSEEKLRLARLSVGWRKLRLEGGRASFAEKGMSVDLGGIAKGYGVDQAAEALREAGVRTALVDVGGDMRLLGTPDAAEGWRVQVRPPPDADDEIVLQLRSCAVATSGDYARGFRVGEQWFSHVLDPRTGRPAESASSVTVVAPDAATADALATALSVMEPEEGLAMVEGMADVECLMFVRSKDGALVTHTSHGLNDLLAQ
jgi:thiamine biosynthesis lipoprotein